MELPLKSEAEMDRRRFLRVSAAVCGAACIAGEISCNSSSTQQVPAGQFDVGTAGDFGSDGVRSDWAATHRFLVIREGKRVYATSAICTHQACVLQTAGGDIVCPCHGSRFSLQGKATKGPASVALDRFGISRDGQGHIIVDTSKRFASGEWDAPSSYLLL